MQYNKLFNAVVNVTSLAKEEAFKEAYRMSQNDFTRNRKLSFFDNLMLIAQCNRCSIQSGINFFLFSRGKKDIEYSKQAFSKGRHRIKHEAFQELTRCAAASFYADGNYNTFNDYLLLSVDGSDYNLPNSAELFAYFGSEPFKYNLQVQAQTSCLYDVLNGIILEGEIEPYNTSERSLAITHLHNFRERTHAKAIVLLDRGYPSFDLMREMEKLDVNYLMRCNKDNFLREVRDTKSDDEIIYITRKGITLPARVVTIKSEKNKVTFITNLMEIDLKSITELYYKRWKIETLYNQLKNKLEIESFSGLDVLCVKQDFYATLLLSNMTACAIYDSQKDLNKKARKKGTSGTYHVNCTFATSELKMRLIELAYTKSEAKKRRISRYILKAIKKNLVLFQAGRSNERKVSHPCIKHPLNMKPVIR